MNELYKEQGVDNLTHAFMRNIKLVRESDYQLITKFIKNPSKMSKAEKKLILDVRGSYTPDKM